MQCNVCMFVCLYVCMFVCVYVCMCVCVYIYIWIKTYYTMFNGGWIFPSQPSPISSPAQEVASPVSRSWRSWKLKWLGAGGWGTGGGCWGVERLGKCCPNWGEIGGFLEVGPLGREGTLQTPSFGEGNQHAFWFPTILWPGVWEGLVWCFKSIYILWHQKMQTILSGEAYFCSKECTDLAWHVGVFLHA